MPIACRSGRRADVPLLESLHGFIAHYGYFAVFLVVALESAGVPLPGETALVTAAIFAGQGTLNIEAVIGCAAVAAILGDNVGYWVGRDFGFPLLRNYGHVLPIDEGKLKVAQFLFLRHGGKIVFFGRFVAILRTFAAFLAGVNRLAYPRFLMFNALGGVTWATLFGLGGYFLGVAFETYARPIGIGALVCAVIGAIVAGRFVAHHAESLRAQAEAALPGPLLAPKPPSGA
jgi:membrane protein DedA with SNARE-associated domain